METIFKTCKPREEVLKGDLREQEFAASLTKVLRDTAEPVYGDPNVFLANTFPAGGLKSLLSEALGRLTGKKPGNAPVIRLETSFGGGKTHNLIALYHFCHKKIDKRSASGFVLPDLVPKSRSSSWPALLARTWSPLTALTIAMSGSTLSGVRLPTSLAEGKVTS